MGETILMRKNKGYIMSKKGQISDMVFVLLTLASIAITLVIAGYVYTQIHTGLDDSGLQSNESAEAYDNFSVAFNFFDAGFGFILAGFIIGLIISAFQIPSCRVPGSFGTLLPRVLSHA